MRVSFNQLKEMVDFSYTPAQLAENLTNLGLEVKEIENVGRLEKVVVGKILDIKKHPNADKLKIVEVDVGGESISFVCGAPNVEKGKCVAVALEGAELPGNVKVKKVRIRGISSPGMICSERELGLGEDHTGIMILPSHLLPGDKLSRALELEDTILDLEITSNRGDCLSVLGVAREIAALTGKKLRFPSTRIRKDQIIFEKNLPRIRINDPELCPFYAARLIKGVKVTTSPLWLRRKILLSGGKPVNNVVDVTNYVMWEMGQPLHPFDLATIKGPEIVVRRSKQGEVLLTLDEKERRLTGDMLVIADTRDPIALAGVMGGKDTEVTFLTRDILLEAAYFNPFSIRRTSRRLGLSSEASSRFEKGVDPVAVRKALDRASILIQEIAGGKIVEPVLEAGKPPVEKRLIHFRPSKVNQIAGGRIPSETSKKILKRLGFRVQRERKDGWIVDVPSFRQDVKREIDLVEEVCRVYGYNRIGVSLPELGRGGGKQTSEEKVKDLVRELLRGCGFYETINNPLMGEELVHLSRESLDKVLSVRNPLSTQQKFLRTHLFPRLLEVASLNYNQEIRNFRIMEIGKVFTKDETGVRENVSLSGVVVEDKFNFYRLKGIIEVIFDQVGIDRVKFYFHHFPYFSPAESSLVKKGEKIIGSFGRLDAGISQQLKLPPETCVFELNLDFIASLYSEKKQFKPLPKFPSIRRDLSVIIKEDVPAEDIKEHILKKGKYVEEVEFFDLYRGPHIPAGHKSISFSLVFRHPQRTLTDDEVNTIQDRILKSLNDRWGAYLRPG